MLTLTSLPQMIYGTKCPKRLSNVFKKIVYKYGALTYVAGDPTVMRFVDYTGNQHIINLKNLEKEDYLQELKTALSEKSKLNPQYYKNLLVFCRKYDITMDEKSFPWWLNPTSSLGKKLRSILNKMYEDALNDV